MSWKQRMKREIGWLMLAKLAALLMLWALFFSPTHRLAVNGSVTADRLALGPTPDTRPAQRGPCGEHPCD